MSDRDDDFRRLVPMLPGWTVSEPDGNLVKSLRAFRRADYASFGFPAQDAPLPEQMAFVGHLAVALGCRYPRVTQGPHGWLVNLSDDTGAEGYDLAWAACRAAIAAKGGAT